MEAAKMITIEVAYATPLLQRILRVKVPANSSILEGIRLSGIAKLFPEIDLNRQKVGIFSKQKALTDKLQEGDRIEIYRPLSIDPKEARRAKAKKAHKMKTSR